MRFIKKGVLLITNHKQYRLIKQLIKSGNSVSFDSHVSARTILEGKNRIKKAVIDDSVIGYYTYIKAGSFLPKTKIGRFSSIGQNVIVEPGTHSTDLISSHPLFETRNQFLKTEDGYYCEIGVFFQGFVVFVADIKTAGIYARRGEDYLWASFFFLIFYVVQFVQLP